MRVRVPPPAPSLPSARRRLAGFLARFDPKVSGVARSALARVRRLVPGACELVYDNYNALAIGFGPTLKASEVILSIAVYPRWVSLFLMHGKALPDPKRVLRGSGKRVRHVVLDTAAVLDRPAVRALIRAAIAAHPKTIAKGTRRQLVVKAVSAKQRPRRPGTT